MDDPFERQTQSSASRLPPGRVPPTAVGTAEVPAPAPAPWERGLGLWPLRWLRKLEIYIFGVRRTVGPRPGRTPTF